MKLFKTVLSSIVVFAFITSVSSCKDKDDETATPSSTSTTTTTTSTKSFNAMVDGTLFSIDATYGYGTNPANNYTILINYFEANNSYSTSWALQFFGDTTGTYNFSTDFPVSGVAVCDYTFGEVGSTVTYEATSGAIVVTKVDTTNNVISGTFSFTGTSSTNTTVTVTEGTFTDIPSM